MRCGKILPDYNSAMRPVAAAILILFANSLANAGLCDADRAAAADVARLSDHDKFFAIYFWLGDFAPKDRPMQLLVLAGQLHHLSTEPSLAAFPQVVLEDYSLVRINYYNYGWGLDFVVQLADANPYRSANIRVENLNLLWPGGIWADGKSYAAKSFIARSQNIPVLPASWFVWQTAIQDDRKPGYLDALRLKTRDQMDQLSGFSGEVNKLAKHSDYLEVPQFSRWIRPCFFQTRKNGFASCRTVCGSRS